MWFGQFQAQSMHCDIDGTSVVRRHSVTLRKAWSSAAAVCLDLVDSLQSTAYNVKTIYVYFLTLTQDNSENSDC